MRYPALALLFYLVNFSASACSFFTGGLFQPTLERWEQHPGPSQINEGAEGEYWESVPAPVVSNIEISRANYKGNNSCSDSGVITLEVSLPNISTYDISEFGVYFHVVSGELPDMIFPNIPLSGIPKEDTLRFVFPWFDQHPRKQKPLNLVVEARFISNGLDLGSATTFSIEQNDG
ncbi:hypothetical protein [Paraglaciecola sp. T6c]|uniref:hypothetical protein n=1 Tax=Pseudoalteromonas atlantica (strain T6c / ATCC BAA-1087) TaxID=3042615 RepID=UPI0005A11619|nr:hypothetical protein [Paraglaciecola sp. T6c]